MQNAAQDLPVIRVPLRVWTAEGVVAFLRGSRPTLMKQRASHVPPLRSSQMRDAVLQVSLAPLLVELTRAPTLGRFECRADIWHHDHEMEKCPIAFFVR